MWFYLSVTSACLLVFYVLIFHMSFMKGASPKQPNDKSTFIGEVALSKGQD